MKWILRHLRATLARSARDPGVVREIVERAVEEAVRQDAAPVPADETPVDAEIRRVRRALLDALARKQLRALLAFAFPSSGWIRARIDRARCQLAAVGAACLGTVTDAVASVLVATTILGGMAAAPLGVVPTFGFIGGDAGVLLRATPAIARPSQPPTPPAGALPAATVGASVSSPAIDPAAPVGAGASAGVGRENRRIGVGGEASAWLKEHGLTDSGEPFLWVECDPRSTVASTSCQAYDAAMSAG